MSVKVQANRVVRLLTSEEELEIKKKKLLDTISKEVEKLNKKLKEKGAEISIAKQELGQLMKELDHKSIEVDGRTLIPKFKESVVIVNDKQAMEWIKASKNITNKDYIRIKEELNKNPYKKLAELRLARDEEIAGVEKKSVYSITVKDK